MIKVTIDRAKWDVPKNRGTFTDSTVSGYLIRNDSPTPLMCCLGFLGLACGVRASRMRGLMTPGQVPSQKWPKSIVTKNDNTYIAKKLMVTNDSDNLSPSVREARIIKYGRKAGIAFRFVGKYLTKAKEK
jgi:hypothetical protein